MNTNHSQNIKKQYPVIGMSCASYAANVEDNLSKLSGVIQASVNLANQVATIEFQPAVVKPEELKELLVSAGYDLSYDNFAQ